MDRKNIHSYSTFCESEERFKTFLKASSDISYIMNPDWTEIIFSFGGEDFIGEVVGLREEWMDKFIPKLEHQRLLLAINEAIRTKTKYELEHEVKRIDGTPGWVFTRAIPSFDEKGEIKEWIGVARDITSRKQSEIATKQSAHEMALILDSTNELIAFHDTQQNLLWGNRAYVEATGLSSFDLIGKKCYYAWGLDRLCYECPVTTAIQSGAPQTGVLSPENQPHFPPDQGSWMVKASPVKNDKGDLIGVIELSVDITDIAKAQVDLKYLNQSLELRVAERTAELESAVKQKDILLREVHHRVKNNMNIILSLIELQLENLNQPELAPIFQDMHSRVRSMSLIHEKLYQASDLANINFEEYGSALLRYVWRTQKVSGIKLTEKFAPICLTIEQAIPLGLILNELCTNLLKHAFHDRSEGEAIISFYALDAETACMKVQDNGAGFPEGFDWDKTNTLGLHLVKMLVSQISGTLEVNIREGTEFVICFKRQ